MMNMEDAVVEALQRGPLDFYEIVREDFRLRALVERMAAQGLLRMELDEAGTEEERLKARAAGAGGYLERWVVSLP